MDFPSVGISVVYIIGLLPVHYVVQTSIVVPRTLQALSCAGPGTLWFLSIFFMFMAVICHGHGQSGEMHREFRTCVLVIFPDWENLTTYIVSGKSLGFLPMDVLRFLCTPCLIQKVNKKTNNLKSHFQICSTGMVWYVNIN